MSDVVHLSDRIRHRNLARETLSKSNGDSTGFSKVFSKEEDAWDYDPTKLRHGEVMSTETTPNKSLRLAESSNFLEMCLPVLWGDEKTSQLQAFGELLRGAVISFKPTNTFELHLVKNIVAAQWRVERLYRMQKNVYENEMEDGERGRFGLPKATNLAMELDNEIYLAQKGLRHAIGSYNAVVSKNTLPKAVNGGLTNR